MTAPRRKDGHWRWLMCAAILAVAAVPGARAQSLDSLPDPTQPSGLDAKGAATPAAGLALQSTIVSPTRKVAIIRGKAYQVGDRFDGAEIVDVLPYEVVLRSAGRAGAAGKEMRLRLTPRLEKEVATKEKPDEHMKETANERAGEGAK